MDPVDNRFIHSLAFPFNVKGNAISITWSLDTLGDWKRLTIDVIFEMYKGLTTPGPLSSLTLVRLKHFMPLHGCGEVMSNSLNEAAIIGINLLRGMDKGVNAVTFDSRHSYLSSG
ncbi:hypothetical protein Tco_0424275 [Tanacetum coccineum]